MPKRHSIFTEKTPPNKTAPFKHLVDPAHLEAYVDFLKEKMNIGFDLHCTLPFDQPDWDEKYERRLHFLGLATCPKVDVIIIEKKSEAQCFESSHALPTDIHDLLADRLINDLPKLANTMLPAHILSEIFGYFLTRNIYFNDQKEEKRIGRGIERHITDFHAPLHTHPLFSYFERMLTHLTLDTQLRHISPDHEATFYHKLIQLKPIYPIKSIALETSSLPTGDENEITEIPSVIDMTETMPMDSIFPKEENELLFIHTYFNLVNFAILQEKTLNNIISPKMIDLIKSNAVLYSNLLKITSTLLTGTDYTNGISPCLPTWKSTQLFTAATPFVIPVPKGQKPHAQRNITVQPSYQDGTLTFSYQVTLLPTYPDQTFAIRNIALDPTFLQRSLTYNLHNIVLSTTSLSLFTKHRESITPTLHKILCQQKDSQTNNAALQAHLSALETAHSDDYPRQLSQLMMALNTEYEALVAQEECQKYQKKIQELREKIDHECSLDGVTGLTAEQQRLLSTVLLKHRDLDDTYTNSAIDKLPIVPSGLQQILKQLQTRHDEIQSRRAGELLAIESEEAPKTKKKKRTKKKKKGKSSSQPTDTPSQHTAEPPASTSPAKPAAISTTCVAPDSPLISAPTAPPPQESSPTTTPTPMLCQRDTATQSSSVSQVDAKTQTRLPHSDSSSQTITLEQKSKETLVNLPTRLEQRLEEKLLIQHRLVEQLQQKNRQQERTIERQGAEIQAIAGQLDGAYQLLANTQQKLDNTEQDLAAVHYREIALREALSAPHEEAHYMAAPTQEAHYMAAATQEAHDMAAAPF